MSPPADYQVNDLDAFLNEAMRRINAMPDSERVSLEAEFVRAMIAAERIFGQYAFRKPRLDEKGKLVAARNPVSKPLFEAWAVSLASLDDEALRTLIDRKNEVLERFNHIMKTDSEFVISISYSTGVPKRVGKRFSEISKLVGHIVSGAL